MNKTASHASLLKTAADRLRPYCDGGSVVYASMGVITLLILCIEIIVDVKSKFVPASCLLMIVFSVYYLIVIALRKRLTDSFQAAIMLAFTAWFIGTRMILGDITFTQSYRQVAVIAFSTVVCFNFPRLIESEKLRIGFLKLVSLLLYLFTLFMSVTSIIGLVFNLNKGPLFSNILINKAEDNRLCFLTFHPIIVGIYVNIGICAALILIAITKSRVLRVLYALSLPIIFAMFGPSNARASTLLSGLCLSAAVIIWLFYRFGNKPVAGSRKLNRVILSCICIVVTLAVVYGTLNYASLSGTVIASYANKNTVSQDTAQEAEADNNSIPSSAVVETGSDTAVTDDGEAIVINDREMYLDTWLTLNKRTYVFKHIFKLIGEDPTIAVIGKLYTRESFTVEIKNYKLHFAHPHNSFVTALYETGVPGLLLCLVFTVLVIIQAVKALFGSFEKYPIKVKFLIIPLASMFATSMIEPVLFTPYDRPRFCIVNMIMMIFAGYLYSYCQVHGKEHNKTDAADNS